jgi:type II secretory pathway component PulJ
MKTYEVRLEEIRAGLDADFTQALGIRERADETRPRLERIAWERKNSSGEVRC